MVPKIRATRRENIDRRQVRGDSFGMFGQGRGASARGEEGGGAGRYGAGSKRSGALSRRKSPPPAYADTRASTSTKKQNHMIPRFSGICHVFDTMDENISAGSWGSAARDADAISTFLAPYTRPTPGKGPHKPRNTPPEPYRTPGDAAMCPRPLSSGAYHV